MALYTDLQFNDNDVVLDSAGEPTLIHDVDCITQDVKHLIRDSGLMVEIIGQRSEVVVANSLLELSLLIEEDTRLIPGTVEIEQTDIDVFFITADTYDFGNLSLQVNA